MIIYLIKSTLCSGIMLALYFLFLEKEKMHRFNRVYLLLGILVSFIIPVISIQVKQQFVPTLNDTYFTVTHTSAGNASFNSPVGKPGFPWAKVLLIIYIIVSAILLLRFAINVHRLTAKAAKNNKINYKGLKLVLLKENTISHSFLRNIFVSETAFYNHEISA